MDGFLVCSSCGQTFAEFQKVGLLGCPACYAAFKQELGRVFKRLHGATAHTADPKPVVEVEPVDTFDGLQKQLADAVLREDYESAGQIRDRIQKLKAQTDHDV